MASLLSLELNQSGTSAVCAAAAAAVKVDLLALPIWIQLRAGGQGLIVYPALFPITKAIVFSPSLLFFYCSTSSQLIILCLYVNS